MKKALKCTGIIIGILAAAVVVFFGYLSVTEYRPADTELLVQSGNAEGKLQQGQELTVVTWNTGYGCLGENADFFMDGGKGVKTADKTLALENVSSMIADLQKMDPDMIFLQEVDISSTRSSGINEMEMFSQAFPDMDSSFATNFKVAFLPYPVPPIGKVYSGIQTLSIWNIDKAERIQLPVPFAWPVRMANLKRCLLVSRCQVEGTGKELVSVNLHLEAYDSGEGKILQTRQLSRILEEEAAKGNYVIAGGDFNQVFSNVDAGMYPYREGMWKCGQLDTEQFPEYWQFIMDNAVPTCRSLDQPYTGADHETFQYYMIDGFILSENLEALSCETADMGFEHSDHNPVILKVRLKNAE